jgi:RNA polymerase sigma factor for flagellar operon FliA
MDLKEAWKEYKESGSPRAKEALILHYAPLVSSVARAVHRRMPPSVEYADLVGYGFLGLLDAMDRFDPSRGNDFEGYARTRIGGSIIDGLRSENRLPRSIQLKSRKLNHAYDVLSSRLKRVPVEEEVAGYLGMDLESFRRMLLDIERSQVLSLEDILHHSEDDSMNILDSIQDADSPDPENISEEEDLKEIIRRAVSFLPEREKIVLVLYYFEDLSMKEVGEVLGITESRVSQLHASALKHLRHRLLSVVEKTA